MRAHMAMARVVGGEGDSRSSEYTHARGHSPSCLDRMTDHNSPKGPTMKPSPSASSTAASSEQSHPANATVTHDCICKRAHELFLARNGGPGDAASDWDADGVVSFMLAFLC